MKRRLRNWLQRLVMWIDERRYARPLSRLVRDPLRAQRRLLRNIVEKNAETTFGHQHGFAEIQSVADFQSRMTVQDYESLRPFIEEQARLGIRGLTREMPLFYARTSGTTGRPKDIPVTQDTIRRYREGQRLYTRTIYRAVPQAFDGRVLALGGPPKEGLLDCGIPYGSMSGLLYGSLPDYLRSRYVLSADTLSISDPGQRYHAIACEATAARDITLVAAVNPSTLLRLAQVINDNLTQIIEAIALRDSARALELSRLASRDKRITFADLWPGLAAVTTWTGGNCQLYLAELKQLLPPGTPLIELGYLASEGRLGIVIDAATNRQIPNLRDVFYEFVRREEWDNGQGEFLLLDQLQSGETYYVFITTPNGLYRYHINDIVEVDGWYHATPTFRFVQKGRGVTSLTGEKLDERQIIQVMQELTAHCSNSPFFLMLASKTDRCYRLYVESCLLAPGELDRRLGTINLEFRAKRESGRLPAIEVVLLAPGAGEAYREYCIACGQRESQLKFMPLQYADQCHFDLAPWILRRKHVTA